MSGPLVDYRTAATRYDAGRALDDEVLARWRDAVADVCGAPHASSTVVDLGAGTGLFSTAWRAWGAADVVAVEPVAAMHEQAVRRVGSPAGVHRVRGTATALPLQAGTADVVWMSAVLHHVPDRAACAREVHRVLRRGPDRPGVLLIRGYCPDRSRLAWLDRLPGAERSRARFPSAASIGAAFGAEGFALVDAREVEEPRTVTCGAAADWVDSMRDADSLLTALTTEELDAGIASLREVPDEELPSTALTLLTFAARQ